MAGSKILCLLAGAVSIFLLTTGCFFGCQCGGYNNFFGVFVVIGAAGILLTFFSLK